MQCPRCDTAELVERDRTGILIDICHGCRGVWLDRGELDKLIARAVDAARDDDHADDDGDVRGSGPGRAARPRDRDDDDDDDDRRGRRRWWDIFD